MNIVFPFKNRYFPRKFTDSASTRGHANVRCSLVEVRTCWYYLSTYLSIYLSIYIICIIYIVLCIYCIIYILYYVYIVLYIYIYIYILTLSAFSINIKYINNSNRYFFKSVIFQILRIFNGLTYTYWRKKTTFFKLRVSSILWSFSN